MKSLKQMYKEISDAWDYFRIDINKKRKYTVSFSCWDCIFGKEIQDDPSRVYCSKFKKLMLSDELCTYGKNHF